MANESNVKIPKPLYAAAAVGDLAYRRLRRLPATVTELRGRVAGTEFDADRLRGAARVERLRDDAAQRVDRLRDAAQRNATALVTSAQAAQERAAAIYTDLVARGEQVVRDRRVVHATVGIVPSTAARPEAEADTAAAGATATAPEAATDTVPEAAANTVPEAATAPEATAEPGATTSPEGATAPEAGRSAGAGRPATKRTRPSAE